jgi:TonB family protein
VYPPEALASGIEGAVVADVVISETGDVVEAKIVQSVPLLDDAALEALRHWHFAPTLVDGKAAPVRMTVTVNFTKQ